MVRARILVCVALMPVLLLAIGRHEEASFRAREFRNIILVTVDTFSARNIDFLGSDLPTTPFLDSLAARSVVFERAYSPRAVTLPAMTSLFSGDHPLKHQILENGWEIGQDVHLLTEDLQANGFRTWGIPSADVIGGKFGINRGFDFYSAAPPIPHDARHIIERVERILGDSPRLGEPSLSDSNRPFFMFVHFYDPHTEYTPEADALEVFQEGDYSGPVDGRWETFREFNEGKVKFNADDFEHVRDLYNAEVLTMDLKLRELFSVFESTGVLDNSLIVVTADHGENLGEHSFITHGPPYEAALHIPLLIHFPDDKYGGMRIDSLVSTIDIMPTILDLSGVKVPDTTEGRSLAGLITPEYGRGKFVEKHELLAVGSLDENGDRSYSITNGDFRLLIEGGKKSLYDIRIDPGESVNVINENQMVADFLHRKAESMVSAVEMAGVQSLDPETLSMLRSLGYID